MQQDTNELIYLIKDDVEEETLMNIYEKELKENKKSFLKQIVNKRIVLENEIKTLRKIGIFMFFFGLMSGAFITGLIILLS